jgi:AcrR family transcriptional regulator
MIHGMGSRKPDRERQILDVAAALFRARGYQGMRMDDLARQVGLNKGTLYHYFASKSDLLYRVYLDTSDDYLESLRALDADAPPADLLHRVVGDIARAIGRRRDYVCVYFQELHWLDQWLPPEQFEVIEGLQREFRNYLTGVIERGISHGVFRPVDPSVAAFGIIGMAGSAYRWYAPGGRHSIEDVAEMFADLAVLALTEGSRPGDGAVEITLEDTAGPALPRLAHEDDLSLVEDVDQIGDVEDAVDILLDDEQSPALPAQRLD